MADENGARCGHEHGEIDGEPAMVCDLESGHSGRHQQTITVGGDAANGPVKEVIALWEDNAKTWACRLMVELDGTYEPEDEAMLTQILMHPGMRFGPLEPERNG